MDPREARLIAFPPSVDTETTRRILSHHRQEFREVRQSAIGSALRTAWHRAVIPILFADGVKLSASRAVADHLDRLAPHARRLVPTDPDLAAEVEVLWKEFNGEMGVAVARWLYHYVLRQRALALRLLTVGVPAWQAALDRALFPLVASGMRLGLGSLNLEVATDALRRCHDAFDAVEARLRDGRPYLLGARFTLADIAFCACAAPVMLADVYGGALPRIEDLPADVQKEVLSFRARDAAAYVLRVYATH